MTKSERQPVRGDPERQPKGPPSARRPRHHLRHHRQRQNHDPPMARQRVLPGQGDHSLEGCEDPRILQPPRTDTPQAPPTPRMHARYRAPAPGAQQLRPQGPPRPLLGLRPPEGKRHHVRLLLLRRRGPPHLLEKLFP